MFDDMPPPAPRPPGNAGGLRRRALAAAATAAGDAPQQQGQAAPRDPAMPLPLPWTSYFDRRERLYCPERQAEFNVYVAGDSGPVLLCLHGGGYTGLSWALIAKALKDRHRIVAPDLRGHGLSTADDEADLAAATLAADVVAIWHAMFGRGDSVHSSGDGGGAGSDAAQAAPAAEQPEVREQQRARQPACGRPASQPPPTVLVGHSMGGAIAVHAAALGGIPSLAGVVVVDVVEGTALASLPFMAGVLAKRPRRFASLAQAVDWALDTGMCKRQEAAHVSLPAMLVQAGSGSGDDDAVSSAGTGVGSGLSEATAGAQPCLAATGLEPLAEEGQEGEAEEEAEDRAGGGTSAQREPPTSAAPAGAAAGAAAPVQAAQAGSGAGTAPSGGAAAAAEAGGWLWRTPLEQSAPFWEGWYTGLSEMFLKLPVPKVLVLVGTDRLDRPLTIGQMQGKFQPVLLPQAGHAVHEDEPERVADAIATFIRRFRIGEPPLAIPRPAPGIRPVLPVPMGPACAPPTVQEGQPATAEQSAQPPQ
ncbi:hypothetical protein ABPG77_006679 [Micractinium sp. CCAP 211/92]